MSEKKAPAVKSTDFTQMGVTSNSIFIQWEMAACDGVPVEEFVYKVYSRQAGTNEHYRVAYQSKGISSYTITGLKPDTDYLVRVIGADEAGNSIEYPATGSSKKIRTDIAPAGQETPDGDDEAAPGNDGEEAPVVVRDEEAPTVDSTEFKSVKVTFNSIHIGWKKATDSVTPAKQIVYKVFVKEDVDTEDEFVAKEAPNLASFTIKDLKPGTEYLVYVRAYDEAGNYIQYPAPDEPARIKTDVVDEEAPVVSNAAFKNLYTTPDSIYVAWDPAKDNLTSSEKIRYCVYLKEDNDSGSVILVKQGLNILSHTFTGLKDKTDYLVHVIASDEAGNFVRYPAQNSSFKVRTGIMDKEAPAVSETSFTVGEVTTSTIAISWEKATDNLTEAEKILYKVYIQEDGSKEEPILAAQGTNLLSHTFTGLKKDTNYLVHVLAFDEAGNCLRYPAPNSTHKIKTDITDDHTAPTVKSRAILVTGTTTNSISIKWEPATDNVTKQNQILYQVWFTMVNVNSDLWHKVEEKGISSYTFNNLKESTEYAICVKAFDEAGNSLHYPDDGDCIITSTDTPDTAAPTVSSDKLSATPTGDSVTLKWKAAKDNVTKDSLIRYKVYRTEFGAWLEPKVVKGVSSYTFIDLIPATKYRFRVEALDEADNVLPYDEIEVKTEDSVPPTAVSAELHATSSGNNNVTVHWAPATDNATPENEILYRVSRSVNGKWETPIEAKHIAAYTFSDLLPATKYIFRVLAFDAAGKEFRYNDFEWITKDDVKPEAPDTGVTLTVKDNKATLSWAAAKDNVTAAKKIVYRVYRTENGAWQSPIEVKDATSYTFNNLGYAKSYNFKVEAVDEAGNVLKYKEVSGVIKDTVIPQIGNPALSLTLVDNSVTVKWAAASDNYTTASKIRYQITCYTESGNVYSSKSVTGQTSQTFTNLVYGSTYRFKVTAFDEADNSINYTEQTKKIVDTKGPTLSNTALTLEAKNNTVTVKWTAASDNATVASKIRYMVSRTENGVWQPEKPVTGSTSYPFTGLTYNKNYTFQVRALDEVGNPVSYALKSMTLRDTDAPTVSQSSLTLTPTRDSITVQWVKASDNATPTDKITYKVYRTQAGVWQSPVPLTGVNSYTFTGLKPSTTYTFRVEAFDGAGNPFTYLQKAATTLEGTAPTVSSRDLTVSNLLDDRFTFSWKLASDNVTPSNNILYKVGLRENGTWRVVREAKGICSHTFTGLKANTLYGYYVNAYDEAGNLLQYPSDGRCNLVTTQRARVHQLTVNLTQGATVLKGSKTIALRIEYDYYKRNSDGSIGGTGSGWWEQIWASTNSHSKTITLPTDCYFKDHQICVKISSRNAGVGSWKLCCSGYVDVANGTLNFKLTGSYFNQKVRLGGTAAEGYAQFK